jgi:hypothetical protein
LKGFQVGLSTFGFEVIFKPEGKSRRDKSASAISDRLQWRSVVGVPKARRFVRVSRVCSDVDVVPYNNDFATLHRAVVERVFTVKSNGEFSRPPRPKKGVFAETLQGVDALLTKLLPSTAPVSHEQFVQAYHGRKKKVYDQALQDIRRGRSTVEEDANLKVFVKFEKTDHTTKKNPVPRVISPRDPKFNIRIGRYLKFLEHRMFKSLDRLFGHPTVLKGYNAERSAIIMREKWDMYSDPVAVGLDASRFDQHVSLDALRWEHSQYLKCFFGKHRKRLGELLKLQEVNHCFGSAPDGELKYTVVGTRMSGDMNTSLGNCVLMVSLIKAYALEKGINLQLANNGDDCVVFMDRRHLSHFSEGLDEWFLSMGFSMTVEPAVDEFEELEFCQTKPVFDGAAWVMCRKPREALVKDSVMLNPWQGESLFLGWLDAVGTGGMSLAGGLPIFQEFYRLYQRSGKKRKVPDGLLPWSFRTLCAGQQREYGAVSPHARASFYQAFGVTPDEQICIEKYYAGMVVMPEVGAYRPRTVFSE